MTLSAKVPPSHDSKAFTLVEVMTVVAILAILSGLIAAVGPRILENGKLRRAQADIHVIQQGLETYKTRFGDYPIVPDAAMLTTLGVADANEYLVNALNGRIGPTHAVINSAPMLNNALLTFEKTALPLTTIRSNRVIDPWGQPYVYAYDPNSVAWARYGYKLRSIGANGTDDNGAGDDIVAK